MQVSGGSQKSFNAVNTLRLQGRCVRMITIPPGDLQRHAGHRIGRSTTQVSGVKQESIS